MKVNSWIEALRPHHWLKSGFCFSAVFFSGSAGTWKAWWQVFPVAVAFSILASAGYLFNDLINREEDRRHPSKKQRPIASRKISTESAGVIAALLALAGLLLVVLVYGWGLVLWTAEAYLLTNLVYSLVLRGIPLVDVMVLASGFVLRVLAGAFALGLLKPEVHPTPWLVVCTYCLALMLGFGKRRAEWLVLRDTGTRIGATRGALTGYTLGLLDAMLGLTAIMAGITYVLYCMTRDQRLFLATAIPVVIGLMSYVRTASRSSQAETPERLLFRNPLLLACVASWLLLVAVL